MARRRIQAGRRSAVAASLLVVLLSPGASTAEPPPPPPPAPPVQPCMDFAASPGFASDRTAFCAGHVRNRSTGATTSIAVFRTTDGGRSWSAAPAAGLSFNTYSKVTHLSVSPLYQTDKKLFVQIGNTGLFESTDNATTFRIVDPLAWNRLAAFVSEGSGGVLPGIARRTVFAMAAPAGQDGEPNKSALIDPLALAHTPVKGTPARDREFAVSDTHARDGAAFAVADAGVGLTARVELYRCSAIFACDERLYAFPKRWTFDRIWLSRDFATTRTLYVSMTALTGTRTLWWSRDAGRTWARWAPAERLLTPVTKANGSVQLALGRGPARLLYLRFSSPGDSSAEPAEQLFRSRDNGATWTRIAYGRRWPQQGPRGTMPWDNRPDELGDGTAAAGGVTVASSTTVFTLGGWGPYDSFYCSSDGGRHWGRNCR